MIAAATTIARTMSMKHPRAMLPCPRCAATVRGENLERHLENVHRDDSARAPLLSGVDRAVGRELAALLVFAIVIAAIIAASVGERVSDAWVAILGLPIAALLFGIAAASLGVFRARLLIDEGRVELRYLLGLRRRVIDVEGPIETGRLWTLRPVVGMQSIENARDERVDAGMYVRLSQGRRRITIGCADAAPLSKHWSSNDARRGARTRFWDITLDREGMTALQYQLAERGLLSPRS